MFKLKLARVLTKLWNKSRIIKYDLLSTACISGGLTRVQPVLVVGLGTITASRSVRLGCYPSPHYFTTYAHIEARRVGSKVLIGEDTQINNGFVAIAEQTSIEIGKACLIGTFCEIYDSDFHAISSEDRCAGVPYLCKPIKIEDHVFIGSNVKILKGVTIGEGAVIGNQSVVTKDIPPRCIAVGNPAKPKSFLT